MAGAGSGTADSSSEHIQQLNDIDREIVKLLESAGAAVAALTSTHNQDLESNGHELSIEERKSSFTTATSQYFALLSSIDVGLRRQINALEEADIILADTSSKDNQTTQTSSSTYSSATGAGLASRQMSSGKSTVTGGGLGSLDVGWLNSRNDKVGREKEATLWEEAAVFAESVQVGPTSARQDQGRTIANDDTYEASSRLINTSTRDTHMDGT